jgi:type IV pilus assembly protein PilW
MSEFVIREKGFSLIELMIAMLIGLLLLLGITSLFNTTASVNRMENGLARLQENGRFALDRIADDIRIATAVSGSRKASEGGGRGRVNPDRPLVSYVNFGATPELRRVGFPGVNESDQADVQLGRYFIPASFMMRAAECSDTCIPNNFDDAAAAWDGYNVSGYGPVPAVGTTAGSRAAGSDVLTVRYVRGVGVPLAVRFVGVIDNNAIILNSPLTVGPSRILVMGDYATTAFIRVNSSGTASSFRGVGELPNSQAMAFEAAADVRVRDFDTDFVTVTYYLRLEQDMSRSGRLVSSLRRRENGIDVAIAEGIERLDFLYHVEDATGSIRPMTAAQVHAFSNCPPASITPELRGETRSRDICGWRSIRAVEIYILANTIDDTGAPQEPFQYSFLQDGSPNTSGTVEVACDPVYNTSCPANAVQVLPSGLPPGRMLRREFRTTVTLRNNAY